MSSSGGLVNITGQAYFLPRLEEKKYLFLSKQTRGVGRSFRNARFLIRSWLTEAAIVCEIENRLDSAGMPRKDIALDFDACVHVVKLTDCEKRFEKKITRCVESISK